MPRCSPGLTRFIVNIRKLDGFKNQFKKSLNNLAFSSFPFLIFFSLCDEKIGHFDCLIKSLKLGQILDWSSITHLISIQDSIL